MLPPNYDIDIGASLVAAESVIIFLPDGNVDIQSTRPKATLIEQLRALADALATDGDTDANSAGNT